MKLKILYYYYCDKVEKPDVDFIIDEHKNFEDIYNEPSDINKILDIYNSRIEDFNKNLYYTDIYYLITDLDNKPATLYLIEKTQNDIKFKGWLTDGKIYNYINDIFVRTGKLEGALEKVKNLSQV